MLPGEVDYSVPNDTDIAEAFRGLWGEVSMGSRKGCRQRTSRGGSWRKPKRKADNSAVVKGGASNSVGACKGGLLEELTWATMVLLLYGEEEY